MIELTFPTYSQTIKLEHPFSLLAICENKQSFIQFMMCFHSERISDMLVAYDEEKASFWDKDNIRFIDSALFVDPNDKKNLAALRKQLKKRYSSQLNASADIMTASLTKVFEEIRLDYDIDLYSDISIKPEDLIKIMDIKVSIHDESLLERILQYLKVTIELAGTKLFIFHHLSFYLEDEEIKSLIHELGLLGGSLIDLESNELSSNLFDKRLIFDKDFNLIS